MEKRIKFIIGLVEGDSKMREIVNDSEIKEIKKIVDILDPDNKMFLDTREYLKKQEKTSKKRVKYFEQRNNKRMEK